MKWLQLLRAFTFFQLIIIVVACSSEYQEKSAPDVTTFHINTADAQTLVHNSVFDSISFVKLETTEEAMLGWIRNIVFNDGRMYIRTNEQETIFIFDKTGKYIGKIANQGKGPGEYNRITSFAVDPVSGNVLVLSAALQKLLTYDRDGNFIAERAEEVSGHDFIINNGKHIFSSNRQMNFDTPFEGYNLIIKDDKGKLLNKGVPIEPYFENFVTSDRVFSQFRSTVAYFQPYADTIYHINKKGILPVYCFDFGKNSLPYADFFDDFMRQNPMQRLKKLNNIGPNYAVNNFFEENSSSVFFRFVFNEMLYGGIIDKKKGTQQIFDKIINNGFIIKNHYITGFNDDRLVSVINAHDILEQYNSLDKESLSDDFVCLTELIEHTTINDNPVVVYHHLRE